MEISETTIHDLERLKDFMVLVDHEFFPSLSRRPGGIKGRISTSLSREDSNYLIAEIAGQLVGAIGYKKNWNNTREAYISFIAVHPDHRGKQIARALEEGLAEKLHKEGISHINVTTWSTNPGVCRMYRSLGYQISRILKDDRGPGVDTIYFRKHIS